jgi:hypothetical protein
VLTDADAGRRVAEEDEAVVGADDAEEEEEVAVEGKEAEEEVGATFETALAGEEPFFLPFLLAFRLLPAPNFAK